MLDYLYYTIGVLALLAICYLIIVAPISGKSKALGVIIAIGTAGLSILGKIVLGWKKGAERTKEVESKLRYEQEQRQLEQDKASQLRKENKRIYDELTDKHRKLRELERRGTPWQKEWLNQKVPGELIKQPKDYSDE